MPKESTHIFFSKKTLSSVSDVKLKEIILKHKNSYYLGSIAPDTFFYSGSEKVATYSQYIHGKKGNLTNEVIFDLLDDAKLAANERELAFVLGFITHCVLDMVFHPVITYLVGSIDNNNPQKKAEYTYRHRYWETLLDKKLGHHLKFTKYVRYSKLNKRSYYEWVANRFKAKKDVLIKVAKKQILVNRLLKSTLVYFFAWLLYKLDYLKKQDIAIFYACLRTNEQSIGPRIIYRDIIDGQEQITTLEDLFNKAEKTSEKRIQAAYDYYLDKINKKQALAIIKGESLETGKIGFSSNDIRYTFEK